MKLAKSNAFECLRRREGERKKKRIKRKKQD